MLVYDWSNPPTPAAAGSAIPIYPSYPLYIRTYGVVGAQPGATGGLPNCLPGPLPTSQHPKAGQPLARGAGPNAVIGNRIYLAWGVGDDGILQIVDRKKLLPSPHGTWDGQRPDTPTDTDLLAAQAGILHMSPDQGGHTSMPVFGLAPKSYEKFTEFQTRDIVLLASEATANLCKEAPHWSFIVDVTVENSKTAPPGTKVEQNAWQGPMILSTMSVDPRAGEKFPRGNYCTRGARYGVHSSEENFRNPYYGRLTFLAYFTGGGRAWGIPEPPAPVEGGVFVPGANAHTIQPG